MKIDDRLKKIIFKKLAKDLSHVEVIPFKGSIWFIDRDKKYWYLELKNNGSLWWRYNFFDRFFQAFSLERVDYEPIIAEWVEEVLNRKVNKTGQDIAGYGGAVEQVLKRKVNKTGYKVAEAYTRVEQVLNSK
jgi:hypothetical protein